MARRAAVSRRTTAYRMNCPGSLEDCLAPEYDKRENTQTRTVTISNLSGLLVYGVVGRRGGAEWCSTVQGLTGVPITLQSEIASGVLLLQVEEKTYALTYGMGRVYLDPSKIEPGFGLRFAIRSLNPERVREVTRNILDERARVDKNSVPNGQEIDRYFIEEYGEIISRLVGESSDVDLTFTRNGKAKFTLRASDSLNLPLAKKPESLVADLRQLNRVTESAAPVPDLEFVEQLREVKKTDPRYDRLEAQLALAFDNDSRVRLSLAYPRDADEDTIQAQTYRIKIAGSQSDPVDELAISDIVNPLAEVSQSERVHALRKGTIQAFLDELATDPCSGQVSCAKWIACDITLDHEQFFFHAGSWYEIGQGYTEYLTKRVDRVLEKVSPIALPDWPADQPRENDYSKYVASKLVGYTVLDTRRISTSLHRRGIEPCDLVGPHGELIHVKPADTSQPLSHLFNQGLVSADLLNYSSEAREKFIAKVKALGSGRDLGNDWRPRTVIFAIASEQDRTLPDSLFTFAKVALVRCLERLSETLQIDVYVTPIKRIGKPASS